MINFLQQFFCCKQAKHYNITIKIMPSSNILIAICLLVSTLLFHTASGLAQNATNITETNVVQTNVVQTNVVQTNQVPSDTFYQDPINNVNRPQAPSYTYFFLRTALIIFLFFGVCLGAYWLLKNRFIKNSNLVGAESKLMQLVSLQSIGVNKQLAVVKVINDFYLLGLTTDSIQFLSKIEDKEAIDAFNLEATATNKKTTQKTFRDLFSNYANILTKTNAIDVTKRLRGKLTNKR